MGDSTWVPSLHLTLVDRTELITGRQLQDTHMQAAHILIKKQFGVDGCQSTLLSQNNGFSPVYLIKVCKCTQFLGLYDYNFNTVYIYRCSDPVQWPLPLGRYGH